MTAGPGSPADASLDADVGFDMGFEAVDYERIMDELDATQRGFMSGDLLAFGRDTDSIFAAMDAIAVRQRELAEEHALAQLRNRARLRTFIGANTAAAGKPGRGAPGESDDFAAAGTASDSAAAHGGATGPGSSESHAPDGLSGTGQRQAGSFAEINSELESARLLMHQLDELRDCVYVVPCVHRVRVLVAHTCGAETGWHCTRRRYRNWGLHPSHSCGGGGMNVAVLFARC
jgi:hypothetical protein